MWYATQYDPVMIGSIDGTDTAPHDRDDASKDKKIKSDMVTTLFVARLDREKTTEDSLRDTFVRFGMIKSITLVRDIATGFSKGYGFVEFEHVEDFREAYRAGEQLFIDGKKVLVDYERERMMPGWIPRRFGGGLSGRKESGQIRFGGRDKPFRVPMRGHGEEQAHGLKNMEEKGSRSNLSLHDKESRKHPQDDRERDGGSSSSSRHRRNRSRSRSRDRHDDRQSRDGEGRHYSDARRSERPRY